MERADVVVVGAGLAGLAAAAELEAAGRSLVLLEARSMVGGRVRTVRVGEGAWGNAGAERVNSEHHLVRELARTHGLELLPRAGFEATVFEGRLVGADRPERPELEAAAEALAAGGDTVAPWEDAGALELDRRSVGGWLDELDLAPGERALFKEELRASFMVAPERVSLASFALLSKLDSSDGALRFADGTGALADAMAGSLSSRVRLSEPALGLAHDARGVTVITPVGEYRAEYALLAAPMPALARVRFEPPVRLPEIGHGTGGKLLVPYRAGMFAAEPDVRVDGPVPEYVYETASHRRGDIRVLVAYTNRVQPASALVRAFAAWFPRLDAPAATPVAAWWSAEPESGLTYSALRPGDLPELARLHAPLDQAGRLHLAGEHTEVVSGYMESAVRSGRRVAQRLAKQPER